MEYVDLLLRTTKVTTPNGHQTITEYGAGTGESTRFVKVRSQIDADHWKSSNKSAKVQKLTRNYCDLTGNYCDRTRNYCVRTRNYCPLTENVRHFLERSGFSANVAKKLF